jgi:hypothetical protein
MVGKAEGKRMLKTPRRRWENVKINLIDTVWEGINWIRLAPNRGQWEAVVNTVINLRVL